MSPHPFRDFAGHLLSLLLGSRKRCAHAAFHFLGCANDELISILRL
jgi:hypothetical protein